MSAINIVLAPEDDGLVPFLAFVEIEDDEGNSISIGEWIKRPDGYSVIRIDALP